MKPMTENDIDNSDNISNSDVSVEFRILCPFSVFRHKAQSFPICPNRVYSLDSN
jgi:hypothetical protein